MKTSNTRKLRAYSLLAHGKVDKISDFAYRVWSQSGDSHYIVVRDGLEWKCECPDELQNIESSFASMQSFLTVIADTDV